MKTHLSNALIYCGLALALGACSGGESAAQVAIPKATQAHAEETPAQTSTPGNRVDIPSAVRQNLGITFAKVESRDVATTLRVPGSFELLPSARREYRTPLGGRVELLIDQYDAVQTGTPLYSIDSGEWRIFQEQFDTAQAKVVATTALIEAHELHEQSLRDRVQLWQDRVRHLEELQAAGGGSAAQLVEARGNAIQTGSELADAMEKDATLVLQRRLAESEVRLLDSRRAILVDSQGPPDSSQAAQAPVAARTFDPRYIVRAVQAGVVESLSVTPGGLVDASGLVVTVVAPEQIRLRARGLQSDLGRLHEGLAARIAPPQGGSIDLQDAMTGTLRLGTHADSDERTVDLIVEPTSLSKWARSGVSAFLEITLDGGEAGLAIPLAAVVRDGLVPIIFRRDPANPDLAIRMEADLGASDGRWVIIESGVREGDEIVMAGNYQLMMATSGSAQKGGHFHSDGTFHDGKD